MASGLRPGRTGLVVAILNYRTAALVTQCLDSLVPELASLGNSRAVVVDNASGDGSGQEIEQCIRDRRWGQWAELRCSPRNGGFSSGNNLVLSMDEADMYLLLNSDTVVREGALVELVRAMKENPGAGIVSPRLEGRDGRAQQSCFRWHRPRDEFFRAAGTRAVERLFGWQQRSLPVQDAPRECEWTSFACVLIRKALIDDIGVLDDGYFLYFEDMDFCRRARDAGWKVLHWPAARVIHLRGGSSPVKALSAQNRRLPQYWYASRTRYITKFHGTSGLWSANALWHAGRVISWLKELICRAPKTSCEGEWRDIWSRTRRPLVHADSPEP